MMRLGTLGGAMLGLTLIAGMMLGANMAAGSGERVDVGDMMREELINDDGTINTSSAEQPQPAPIEAVENRTPDVTPATPTLDATVRQTVVKPMILAMIKVTDVGARVGYALATTIGIGATKFLLSSSVVALMAGATYRMYQIVREVFDE